MTCWPCIELPGASGLGARSWRSRMTDGVNELCPKLPASQPKIGHSEFKSISILVNTASPFLFTNQQNRYVLVGFQIYDS